MKLAIGCDHVAVPLKKHIIAHLTAQGHELIDFGTYTEESCNYPIFAARAAKAVASGECERGILLCGTGIGMSLAANAVKGIRCALCSDPLSAELTRRHNDANMLALGARIIGPELAKCIVRAFLETPFDGGRHQTRVDMITKLQNGEELE